MSQTRYDHLVLDGSTPQESRTWNRDPSDGLQIIDAYVEQVCPLSTSSTTREAKSSAS